MLITSHNDSLIMFSENITVILKFTIDFDGTPVSLLSLTVNFCHSVVSFELNVVSKHQDLQCLNVHIMFIIFYKTLK